MTEYLLEEYVPPSRNSTHDLSHTYSWSSQLAESTFVAAPVSSFGHAPMSDGYEDLFNQSWPWDFKEFLTLTGPSGSSYACMDEDKGFT